VPMPPDIAPAGQRDDMPQTTGAASQQVLAALYSHALEEAKFCTSLPDEVKEALGDHYSDLIERVGSLKEAFATAYPGDDIDEHADAFIQKFEQDNATGGIEIGERNLVDAGDIPETEEEEEKQADEYEDVMDAAASRQVVEPPAPDVWEDLPADEDEDEAEDDFLSRPADPATVRKFQEVCRAFDALSSPGLATMKHWVNNQQPDLHPR
jgi:hypothetical protein